jgi:hypothetical protein
MDALARRPIRQFWGVLSVRLTNTSVAVPRTAAASGRSGAPSPWVAAYRLQVSRTPEVHRGAQERLPTKRRPLRRSPAGRRPHGLRVAIRTRRNDLLLRGKGHHPQADVSDSGATRRWPEAHGNLMAVSASQRPPRPSGRCPRHDLRRSTRGARHCPALSRRSGAPDLGWSSLGRSVVGVACQWDGTTGLPRAWDHLAVVHDRAR